MSDFPWNDVQDVKPATYEPAKLPWQADTCLRDPLAIPDCIKRDKNNVAPFMRAKDVISS